MSRERIPLITDLDGKTHQIRRLVDPEDQTWSATNASIGYSKKVALPSCFAQVTM